MSRRTLPHGGGSSHLCRLRIRCSGGSGATTGTIATPPRSSAHCFAAVLQWLFWLCASALPLPATIATPLRSSERCCCSGCSVLRPGRVLCLNIFFSLFTIWPVLQSLKTGFFVDGHGQSRLYFAYRVIGKKKACFCV